MRHFVGRVTRFASLRAVATAVKTNGNFLDQELN